MVIGDHDDKNKIPRGGPTLKKKKRRQVATHHQSLNTFDRNHHNVDGMSASVDDHKGI